MRYRATGAALLLFLVWAGCGDDGSGTGGSKDDDGDGAGAGTPTPAIVIDIVVDANRDGFADPESAADQDGEERWDASVGAIFLPNLDDDDGDEIRDADDGFLNGGNDPLDLAAFSVTACPDCPDDAYGQLDIDAESAKNVRIYALRADGPMLVAGELAACTEDVPQCVPQMSFQLGIDEVRAGMTFLIEGRDVVRELNVGWQGIVDLSYSVLDAEGVPLTSDANPDGVDRAKMRVAPWQLFGNLSPFDHVWSSGDSNVFEQGVGEGAEHAGVEYTAYSNWGDQWTQDFFQTGFFSMPIRDANGNTVIHGMAVANARPWGRSNSDSQLPIRWLTKNYLGPDKATLVVYKNPHSGDSFDSHGNHDLLPAYTNGAESFPLGRIIHGSGILSETKKFYAAQLLQGPPLVVDTAWLIVGHVDEYLSYVPANTPRGWKLMVGSGRLGREMLLEQQAAGNGAVMMHVGKFWYDFDGGGTYPADISIDDVLADAELLEATQDAQEVIDDEIDKLKAAVGLTDDEIIEIPFIFEQEQYGGQKYKIAYQPGTVNSLVMGNTIVIPKPFGPIIGGVDIFEADLEERLGTAVNGLGSDGQGMYIVFADDWDLYHRLSGEVHCGTNPEASAPFTSVNWWETGR